MKAGWVWVLDWSWYKAFQGCQRLLQETVGGGWCLACNTKEGQGL